MTDLCPHGTNTEDCLACLDNLIDTYIGVLHKALDNCRYTFTCIQQDHPEIGEAYGLDQGVVMIDKLLEGEMP